MKSNKIVRLPRPMGITQLMVEYHSKNDDSILDKVQSFIIQKWIMSNGSIFGRNMGVFELSDFIKCNPDRIRTHMRDQMLSTRIWDKDKQNELLEALLGQQLTWALEDRMEVQNQVNILKKSQGDSYKPFVTSELNKAISMKLGSSSSIQNIIKNLTSGGNSINIFNQFNQQNNQVQGITIEDAVAIVQEENSKSLDPKKEVKYLESNYGMDDLPEVVAIKQKGVNTSKEGLTLNNKELSSIIEHYTKDIDEDKPDHNNRREKELSIDDDSIDPELNIY